MSPRLKPVANWSPVATDDSSSCMPRSGPSTWRILSWREVAGVIQNEIVTNVVHLAYVSNFLRATAAAWDETDKTLPTACPRMTNL